MKKKTNNILAVILIILGIVMLFPIYILFMVSFRNEKTVFVGSLITASPSFESIKSAITPDFLVAIGNSFLIAVAVTIIALILHSMCGYAFARMNFPGKKPMFTVIISTLMIPVSSILVPLFMICKQLGITNSYGRPDAYIISPEEIVSADRILEEFQWRKTKWGDMTRKSWRTDKWTADLSLKKYPTLKSASDILSATWNLAMTVFDRCTNGGYALPGQEHLWQAGLFQCKGEGFGVWLRDSVHIAMRGGNLIDPETAGRSLLYAVKKGFDNGSDGPAMGAVGLWDYYLATGDRSALEEGYETLLETMTEIENRYNEEKGLVRAEQSTSNDAFPEPENAGYSLGSECYYMKAYDSMAKIEKLLHGENEKSKKWSKISEQLCEKIREEYWNDEAGYFTSGPKGSEAYENQIWETSGEEAALWDKFHIATPEQKREILNSGIHTAMTPYGIRLFPHRKEHNHFVGPVWPVWESGFASAAAESQNKELLLTMIAQQMRTAVLHKNFHEVLEADTGKSWRWPGQLWHACGFAAQILYGVFGISYDEQGMRFNPCVPEIFKEIEIQNLNYQSAKLTVKISGTGTVECVILDDEKVDFIPYSLTGNHIVHIKLTETESECI